MKVKEQAGAGRKKHEKTLEQGYITDKTGQKTAVILALKDYQRLLSEANEAEVSTLVPKGKKRGDRQGKLKPLFSWIKKGDYLQKELKTAAETLKIDYQTDPELTVFTELDGEGFHL